MSDISVAAPHRQKIVPAFVVQKLEGVQKTVMYVYDKEGKRTTKNVEEPKGYLVSFPMKGHSIRVKNKDDLERLGFDRTIPLVDASSDNDDVVGTIPNNVV